MTGVAAPGRNSVPAALAWFACWSIAGASWVVTVLGALSIGVFVLPVAIILTVLLATRRTSSVGFPGIISGAGLPLLYVAHLNRGGPGNVCTTFAGGQSCTQEWSPLPWLGIGTALVATGVVAFVIIALLSSGIQGRKEPDEPKANGGGVRRATTQDHSVSPDSGPAAVSGWVAARAACGARPATRCRSRCDTRVAESARSKEAWFTMAMCCRRNPAQR